MEYRNIFYKDYFQQQAGRNTLYDSLKEKLDWDQRIYADEFLHLRLKIARRLFLIWEQAMAVCAIGYNRRDR